MSAPLADALRRLGLPLDETIDDGELGDAYRRAARENHPDGAPDSEREQRGETHARDQRGARSRAQFARAARPSGPTPSSASARTAARRRPGGKTRSSRTRPAWASAGTPAPSGSPGASASSRRASRSASPSATASPSSTTGMLTLGRVEAFDSSVRVSRRTAWGGLPIELRRIGVEVALPRRLALDRRCRRRPRGGLALPRVRAHEHARRAARAPLPALHPALAHRLRALGRPRPPLAQAAPQAARARPRGHAVLAAPLPRLPRRRRRARRRPRARRVAQRHDRAR